MQKLKKILCSIIVCLITFSYLVPLCYAETQQNILAYLVSNVDWQEFNKSGMAVSKTDYTYDQIYNFSDEARAHGIYEVKSADKILALKIFGVERCKNFKMFGGSEDFTEEEGKHFVEICSNYGKYYTGNEEDKRSLIEVINTNKNVPDQQEWTRAYDEHIRTITSGKSSAQVIGKYVPLVLNAMDIAIENYENKNGEIVASQASDADDVELKELTKDDPDVSIDVTLNTKDIDLGGGWNYFSKGIIYLASIFTKLLDGVLNIVQSSLVPGLPTAVAKRINSPSFQLEVENDKEMSLRDVMRENDINAWFYAYYKSGDMEEGKLFKQYPWFIDFNKRDEKYGDPSNPGSGNADLLNKDVIWFDRAYSRLEIPMIFIGPKNILSNKIPIFNVDFFANKTTIKSPILEFADEDKYALTMATLSAKKSEVEQSGKEYGEVKQESLERNIEKYKKIYQEELSASRKGLNKASSMIRDAIAKWYVALRNLAYIFLLLTLVYTGIRIVISNTGDKKAKYKALLQDWITSVFLVSALVIIMAILVKATNIFITTINPDPVFNSTYGDPTLNIVRYKLNEYSLNADFPMYLGYLILYGFLTMFTISLIYLMLKRVVYMGMLTILSPLVGLSYSIDKVKDGKSQGFDFWLKEYIFNLLQMPVYLLVYMVFVDMVQTYMKQNILVIIICLAALNEMVDGLRTIFNIKFKNNNGKSQFLNFVATKLALKVAGGIGKLASAAAGMIAGKGNVKKVRDKLREDKEKYYRNGGQWFKDRASATLRSLRAPSLSGIKRRAISGFKKTFSKQTAQNIKKKTIKGVKKTWGSIKFNAIKGLKHLNKNKGKIAFFVVQKGASVALATATTSLVAASALVKGDFDAALVAGASAFSETYGRTNTFLKNQKDFVKGTYNHLKITNYEPQSTNPGQPGQIQYANSEEWINDERTKRQLRELNIQDKDIAERKEDLKLLYLSGVEMIDMGKGLNFMKKNPEYSREAAAQLYNYKELLDASEYNPTLYDLTLQSLQLDIEDLKQRRIQDASPTSAGPMASNPLASFNPQLVTEKKETRVEKNKIQKTNEPNKSNKPTIGPNKTTNGERKEEKTTNRKPRKPEQKNNKPKKTTKKLTKKSTKKNKKPNNKKNK